MIQSLNQFIQKEKTLWTGTESYLVSIRRISACLLYLHFHYTTKVLLRSSITNCIFLCEKDKYIFVNDDDQSARSGIARLLRAAGHAIREFVSVREFLKHPQAEAGEGLVAEEEDKKLTTNCTN